MLKNVGGPDRIIRIVVGLGLLGFAVFSDSPARAWGYVGLVPLLTALIGVCPLYRLVGLNTCPAQR